ncbi:MAG TPA: adenosylcobalamin-dependent ribonucleoside-diphosphate reductase [Chloroflexi bacterium]|nr:adenosylcobalamin-dependent ribonucleoside-diphosphate reductase [Chloroflexota bacterium]
MDKVRPEYHLKPVETLTENARVVLEKRYLRRGDDGNPIETVEEMFWRVAYNVAIAERDFDEDPDPVAEDFYQMLTEMKFLPNSPTFTGAGTPLGQLAACFVLPISDDMGGDSAGIFQTLRDAALIQQTGGGNGFSFSKIRARGSIVKSSAGEATGPVGFLRVYDRAFGEIAQGGTRRGANMAVLRVDHPDIYEFITCKTDENQITNFNISVGITDDFMQAVENDRSFELICPQTKTVKQTVNARDLFNTIVKYAHHNGEPGVLFLDAANRQNPLPHMYDLESTNPCGEQYLGPYENCCLGSINLAKHLGEDGKVDWISLANTVALSTRFLDNVVTANAYVSNVPQLREAAMQARRIGLGIMGLGDMMYHVGIRYGSQESEEFASQLMEFVRYHCMLTSIKLSEDRGPYLAIKGSIYDPEDMNWRPPKPVNEFSRDFGRPKVDWDSVVSGIKQYGIRNAAQTTIAPTGTIATVAGCEAYGCEPAFALAYLRHVNDKGKDLQLEYASPMFEKELILAGLDEKQRSDIVSKVRQSGSCQNVDEVPEHIKNTFVVSQDITAEQHVRMQAGLQAFVDNSLSKTCNFPSDAKEEDVAEAYTLGWKLGCKGLTVYVTGSRQKVVLETNDTADNSTSESDATENRDASVNNGLDKNEKLFPETKKSRPSRLDGATYMVDTPMGKSFVTINENESGEPFEAFVSTAKAGSETAAISEAIGRLISYVLRISSPVLPSDRLKELVRQLEGIGGSRSLGFGPNRVRSLPDGVARALRRYLDDLDDYEFSDSISNDNVISTMNGSTETDDNPYTFQFGSLCPECGEAAVVNEEGCRKCYACSYSEC